MFRRILFSALLCSALSLSLVYSLLSTPLAFAADAAAVSTEKQIPFTYKREDVLKVIEDYAKASGQRFVVDPQVRGAVSIFNPGPVTLKEAFNQLSSALAINGFSYINQDDVLIVKQARAIQRDALPLITEAPPMRPERQMTWVITLNYISADQVNRELRILTSKDGELVPYTETNQIIVSDYTPNLIRIGNILKLLDTPENVQRGKAHVSTPKLAPKLPTKPGDQPHFRPGP